MNCSSKDHMTTYKKCTVAMYVLSIVAIFCEQY